MDKLDLSKIHLGFGLQIRYVDLPVHVRGYIHDAGWELYSDELKQNFMDDFLEKYKGRTTDLPDWMIIGAWANKQDGRVLDVVEFKVNTKGWQKNPDTNSFNVRENGRITSSFEACGDFQVVLGLEEIMRRRQTKNLNEYQRECYGWNIPRQIKVEKIRI